jgi:ABC-type multidrug transport system ATPase subunit
VPERFPADQPFTAEHYLRRMAELRGRHDPALVGHWVERLLLAEHTGTRLPELSKGTAQKVGLAQALLVRPGLLVLDEPWEGLDAVARTLIPAIVAEVTTAGGVVLVSDHRGEITALPGARHWTVADGTLHIAAAPPPAAEEEDEVIVEVAVRRSEADRAVVALRASGHRVLGVRG